MYIKKEMMSKHKFPSYMQNLIPDELYISISKVKQYKVTYENIFLPFE